MDRRMELLMTDEKALLVRFRVWLGLFIIGLVLSGVTAFPLAWEVRILTQYVGPNTEVVKFTLAGEDSPPARVFELKESYSVSPRVLISKKMKFESY